MENNFDEQYNTSDYSDHESDQDNTGTTSEAIRYMNERSNKRMRIKSILTQAKRKREGQKLLEYDKKIYG